MELIKWKMDDTLKVAHKKRFAALAIDGGGVRGLIPAMLLQDLEKRAESKVGELFDYFAGSSAGAIVVSGISLKDPVIPGKAKFAASDIVHLFRDDGKKIFPAKTINVGGYFTSPKYDSQALLDVLASYYGRDAKMDDLLGYPILTSFETNRQKLYTFEKKNLDFAHVPLVSLVAASGAAVPYFPAVEMVIDGESHCFIDGGFAANNPAQLLHSKILHYEGSSADVMLLSLGTGKCDGEGVAYGRCKNWGLLGWGEKLVQFIFQGTSCAVEEQLRQTYSANDSRCYWRLQPSYADVSLNFENASDVALQSLQTIAGEFIDAHEDELREVAKSLEDERIFKMS
jgi:uncharacterized protein